MSRTPARAASIALVVATLASACSESAVSFEPTFASPGSSSSGSIGSAQLRGTVYEVTTDGVRPLNGVTVTAGTSAGTMQTVSNAAGVYNVPLSDSSSGGSGSDLAWIVGHKFGFSQPCQPSVPGSGLGFNRPVDIFLVANQILSTSGMPPYYPLTPPSLNGTVTRSGVAAAGVAVVVNVPFGASTVVAAQTFTNAHGRYTVCGVRRPFFAFDTGGTSDFKVPFAFVGSSRPNGGWAGGGMINPLQTSAFDFPVD